MPPLPLPTNLISGAFGQGTQAILSGFIQWLSAGATWVVSHVIGQVMTSTASVNLSGKTFAILGRLGPLAVVLVLPVVLVATISAILHQDMHRLIRAWVVALPMSAIGTGIIVGLTATGISVTDELCAYVQSTAAPDMTTAFAKSFAVSTLSSLSGSGVVTGLLSVLVLLGAVALWLELLVRSAAVMAALFLMPLALSGLVWPSTAHWARRAVEVLAALVLSKFVIIAILSLGCSLLSELNGIDAELTGTALLLMAAYAPFTLLKLVPIAEMSAISHLEGMARRPVAAAGRLAMRASAASVGGAPSLVGADMSQEIPHSGAGSEPQVISAVLAQSRNHVSGESAASS